MMMIMMMMMMMMMIINYNFAYGSVWVLRRIYGPKRDEVTGDWRKLHNEELHNLYSSPNTIRMIKSRKMRWAEHVGRMGETRNAYRILVGRPEGKRPLGRPRCSGWTILK
jgi:hypothetical protein